MAFFKLPWLSPKAPIEKPGRGAKTVRGETVEVMRRRARHRLIGAALLVVVGVVVFPVLFDTQPRSVPVDARIEIPDRDSVAPLVVPAETAVVAPSPSPQISSDKPVTEADRQAPKIAATVESSEKSAEHSAAKSPAQADTKIPPKNSKPPALVDAKPDVDSGKRAANESSETAQRSARQQEADRAMALLEGRSGKAPVAAPPIPVAAAGAERFIVQVGAFSDDSKAREARSKLERSGLATYTQAVQTKDGKRTRVRVGPFQGREAAEKAAAKIKALGLPAAVLTL